MSILIRLLSLLPLLLGTLAFTRPEAARPKAITVYLVRHAEKDVNQDPQDPPLTRQGEQRAQDLLTALRKQPVVAIYSTNTRRTKATAEPLATVNKLEIQPYTPNGPGMAELATRIRQTAPGKAVLVVGHSNTVLETIEALGAVRPVKAIGDDEFNYLFEVKLPANGSPATATAKRYGAAPTAAR